MEIGELLKKGIELIKDNEYSNPNLESIWVLSDLLNVDRSYIHTNLKEKVNKNIGEKFIWIMKKRKEGYPLQYLINNEEFMGLDFYIEEGVLIPRPETEILVEYVIDYINKKYKNKDINILEIGVGSGAISLSIGKEFLNARVIGTDIGDIPIKVSNINKRRLGLGNVKFLQGDLFKALELENIDEKFHIIISNPPYIESSHIEKLQKEVKEYEPRLALDGGEDGLEFYKNITKESRNYLKDKGMLIYEIGYKQGKEVSEILRKEGFVKIQILKDFQNHDRIVLGFKM